MEILIVIGIIVIIIVFFVRKNKKATPKTFQNQESFRKQQTIVSKKTTTNENLLYKNKGVKRFELRGMYFRNLSDDEVGQFNGYAECDYNEHDQYAVAIYNESGTHLGFVPKGNKRLHDSIEKWHSSKVIAWGQLMNDKFKGEVSWDGNVFIPVGYSEIEIDKLKEIFSLIKKRKEIQNKQNATIEEYFSLLSDFRLISQYRKSLENLEGIDFELPKTIIPTLSKKLETEKNWEQLVKLDEYSDLIKLLNEKNANSTINRIEKAKINRL